MDTDQAKSVSEKRYIAEVARTVVQPSGAAEQPLNLRITYQGVLELLVDDAPAGGYCAASDLRALRHRELAAALERYPAEFYEALVGDDGLGQLVAAVLATPDKSDLERLAAVGIAVVNALQAYFKDLVLSDVNAVCERNAELDRLEDRLSHHERNTDAEELAVELGLGRTLR